VERVGLVGGEKDGEWVKGVEGSGGGDERRGRGEGRVAHCCVRISKV
jgi:hypothetical protein